MTGASLNDTLSDDIAPRIPHTILDVIVDYDRHGKGVVLRIVVVLL